MDKENILYYQSNIKTSRNKDSVYAMKYANQQMLIDKLEQQCKKQKEVIDKAINDLNIIIDIVRELPLGSDCWIIDRLEANKSILKEVSE